MGAATESLLRRIRFYFDLGAKTAGITISGTDAGSARRAIGYYEGPKLLYAARTRNGFTPVLRAKLFEKLTPLETRECPFANLPEKTAGRWGAGLTAKKMADCRWLKPVLVGQFEFVEWTGENHLRHTRFTALRDDKKAIDVRRERGK
jgi:ATP-dependent DNA ligase